MDKDRTAAFEALKLIETENTWSNLALGKVLKASGADQPFVRELVYGILRNRLLIDHTIDGYLKKPHLRTAERILLRMGVYQLCFMDSVTPYAAVNETVELARQKARGSEGFINGVLRAFLRDGARLQVPEISEALAPK